MGAVTTKPLPATRYPGVGPRAVATLIDCIAGFIIIGLPILAIFGNTTTSYVQDGNTVTIETTRSTNDPNVLLLWLVLAIAYYVIFEATVAATPGKFLLGLRVRDSAGEKITWKASLIRNALRVVDAFPYFIPYLTGAIAIWTDDRSEQLPDSERRRRRMGDRFARTFVTYR